MLVLGQSGAETCALQRKGKHHVLRELFAERRSYEIVGNAQCGSEARMLLT